MQPENCVLVEGLAEDATTDDLYASFSEYGLIAECHVVHNAGGKSLKYGNVTYETVEPAAKLLDGGHGVTFVGSLQVHIRPGNSTPNVDPELLAELDNKRRRMNEVHERRDRNSNFRKTNTDANSFKPSTLGRKLFVGGLPPGTVTADLRAPFEEFGALEDCVVHGKDDKRCFGFVTFVDPLVAQDALLKQIKIRDRRVYVEFAEGMNNKYKKDGILFGVAGKKRRALAEDHARIVFIRKLPNTVNQDRLKLLLGKFGDVVKAFVNSQRGTGFVEFTVSSSAKCAAEEKWVEVDNVWAQLFTYEDREENDGNFDELVEMEDNIGLALQFETLEVENYVAPTLNGTNEPDLTPEQEETDRLSRLFVGNIPKQMNSLDLRNFFEKYMPAENMLDVNVVIGRGFAFVLFKDELAAAEILSQTFEIDGRLLNILYHSTADNNANKFPKGGKCLDLSAPIASGKLFVGQIDNNVTEHEFRSTFDKLAKVIDIALFPHRGFGYVQFADHESAERVLVTELRIRGRRLKLSLCNVPPKLRNKG